MHLIRNTTNNNNKTRDVEVEGRNLQGLVKTTHPQMKLCVMYYIYYVFIYFKKLQIIIKFTAINILKC